MKKAALLIFAFVFALILSSCGGERERFFDYQENIRSVSGKYSSDGTDYEVALYFEKTDSGKRCRRIEYSSPESLSGISYTLEGESITAELDGIRIAYSYYKAEDVFALSCLFSLCEADIYEISGSKDKTVAKGKREGVLWQVVTDGEGIPKEITYEDKDTAVVFKVSKIAFFEENNGTK